MKLVGLFVRPFQGRDFFLGRVPGVAEPAAPYPGLSLWHPASGVLFEKQRMKLIGRGEAGETGRCG